MINTTMPHTTMPQTPMPGVDPTVINTTVLGEIWELVDSDQEQFAKLIHTFLTSAEQLMKKLVAAVGQNDTMATQRATHDIKSMSAMFGAIHLADLARDMEHRALSDGLDQAEALTIEMQKNFFQVRHALLEMASTENPAQSG